MPNEAILERRSAPYENLSDKFVLPKNIDYVESHSQYYRCYEARMRLTRPILERRVKEKFDTNKYPLKKSLAEVQLFQGQPVSVVGTLFKVQELKPSVLKRFADDIFETPQPIQTGKFMGASDILILEDEVQRIDLIGNVDITKAVTGVPIAICGFENDEGKFEVEDYCFIDPDPPSPLPEIDEDKYILFLSGLNFDSQQSDNGYVLLATELLADWLSGKVGSAIEKEKVSKICRVVIAGNLISAEAADKEYSTQAKYMMRKQIVNSVEAMVHVDSALAKISPFIEMDIMPGENDPSNHFLPQQPLHKFSLLATQKFGAAQNVTNPYRARIGGVEILGHSGIPLDDIFRYSAMNDRLKILRSTLEWGHLCPTAPDTLDMFPFCKEDPLVFLQRPHIFFAGNQPKLQWEIIDANKRTKTLLLCIPSFAQTATGILVNLKNFSVEIFSFGVKMEENFENGEKNEENFGAEKNGDEKMEEN